MAAGLFVSVGMLAMLVSGVWKQIWWTGALSSPWSGSSRYPPTPTPRWLTAHRSSTHLSVCYRVGGGEIWNVWDPDCFIARLSEPLYSAVLLGPAISHLLEGARSAWRIHPLHSKSHFFMFGWKQGSTDFSVFFIFIFAESPVLVCQLTQHECLQGTCWTAPLYTEMWKIWDSIWQ